MTPPSQPTPGPCGCTASHRDETPSGYKYGEIVIAYCPIHAAAREMLDLLKAMRTSDAHKTSQELGQDIYCYCDAASLDDLHESEHAPICQTARALLARIEGKEKVKA